MHYIFFLIGFIILIKCADFFVDGGVELAALLGVSPLFIGLSIAALGTSAPEAAVSIKAALISHPTISYGNILGSNIANIGLVIGLCATIFTLKASVSTIKKELPFNIFIIILLFLLLKDNWYSEKIPSLSRVDGGLLIFFFIFYLVYLYKMASHDRKRALIEKEIPIFKHTKKEFFKASFLTIIGITGVIFSSQLVVDNAIIIARNWGVSETMISVTFIALGTSLPELVTSITALFKGSHDIALGNIAGSNIFNILFVLGITSLSRPIIFPQHAFIDLFILLGISSILFVFIYTKNIISKKEGIFLLSIYLLYIIFVILRR